LRLSTGGLNAAAAVVLRVVWFQSRTMSVDDCATVGRAELSVPIRIPIETRRVPRAIHVFIQHLRLVFAMRVAVTQDVLADTDRQWTR
jgi:hypothetical protein